MIFGAIIFSQCHSHPNDSLTLAEYESSSLATMSESPSGSITFWSKVRHHRESVHNDRLIFNNEKKKWKKKVKGVEVVISAAILKTQLSRWAGDLASLVRLCGKTTRGRFYQAVKPSEEWVGSDRVYRWVMAADMRGIHLLSTETGWLRASHFLILSDLFAVYFYAFDNRKWWTDLRQVYRLWPDGGVESEVRAVLGSCRVASWFNSKEIAYPKF